MGKIRIMSESLANLIAAGEVVEGPYSVVRELVDNSLDAGATAINVSIEEGGLRSIRVADDGVGMDRKDAELCLERYATSKIYSPDDLRAIATRGFRGEALAAILAVSDVKIDTWREGDDVSTIVHGARGKILSVGMGARGVTGTTVTVSQLFYNIPARRKDCASPFTEARRVLQVVSAYALAHPHVTFKLVSDGQELLYASRTKSVLERIRQVHGAEFADDLVCLEAERDTVRVIAYMTPLHKAVRRNQRTMLLVNGRSVTTYALRGVLKSVLGSALPDGHSIEAIVFVTLPVSDVDPNVKPDKSEVRFRNNNQVWATVADAAQALLASKASVPVIGGKESLQRTGRDDALVAPAVATTSSRSDALLSQAQEFADDPSATGGRTLLPSSVPGDLFSEFREEPQAARVAIPANPEWVQQIADTFILCPDRDSLLIIDQHSAHERVKYEEFKARYVRERGLERQYLVIPQIFKLSPREMLLVREMIPLLERLGFEVTAAGSNEVWLHSTPFSMSGKRHGDTFLELLALYEEDDARAGDGSERLTAREEKMLQTLACKAAIKSGQRLSEIDMRKLLEALSGIDLAARDVHGRPGMLRLPYSRIGALMERSSISWRL